MGQGTSLWMGGWMNGGWVGRVEWMDRCECEWVDGRVDEWGDG